MISNRFTKSAVGGMFLGSSGASLIALAASPLITRLYSPADFGIQGVFLAWLAIAAPLAALRFPLAIAVAKSEQDAIDLRRLSWLTTWTFSTILWLIIAVTWTNLPEMHQTLGWYIWLLPLALLTWNYQEVAINNGVRSEQYRTLSFSTVLHSLALNGGRVLGGIAAPVATTLVAISTAGPLVNGLIIQTLSRQKLPPQRGYASIAHVWRKYGDFPRYRSPTDVLNALAQTFPTIAFATFYGPVAAGLFSLAQMVTMVPLNVMSQSVGLTVLGRMGAKSRRGENLFPYVRNVVRALLLACLLTAAPGVFLALWLFGPVFGTEYTEGGTYAAWQILSVSSSIVAIPAVRATAVIGQQRTLLVANGLMLPIRLGSMLLTMALGHSPLTAMAVFAVAVAVTNAVLTSWILRLIRLRDPRSDEKQKS